MEKVTDMWPTQSTFINKDAGIKHKSTIAIYNLGMIYSIRFW
jgi:hypothetical protein